MPSLPRGTANNNNIKMSLPPSGRNHMHRTTGDSRVIQGESIPRCGRLESPDGPRNCLRFSSASIRKVSFYRDWAVQMLRGSVESHPWPARMPSSAGMLFPSALPESSCHTCPNALNIIPTAHVKQCFVPRE